MMTEEISLSISGEALFLHAKQPFSAIHLIIIQSRVIHFATKINNKRVFKGYCTTLNRAFIGWTLHMIMCSPLEHSVTFHILHLL